MELREDMSAAIMTASMTPRTPAGKSSFTSLTKAKLVQPPLKVGPNAFYSKAGVILIPLKWTSTSVHCCSPIGQLSLYSLVPIRRHGSINRHTYFI